MNWYGKGSFDHSGICRPHGGLGCAPCLSKDLEAALLSAATTQEYVKIGYQIYSKDLKFPRRILLLEPDTVSEFVGGIPLILGVIKP